MATLYEDRVEREADTKPCGIVEMGNTIMALLAIIVVPAVIGIAGLKLISLVLAAFGLNNILSF